MNRRNVRELIAFLSPMEAGTVDLRYYFAVDGVQTSDLEVFARGENRTCCIAGAAAWAGWCCGSFADRVRNPRTVARERLGLTFEEAEALFNPPFYHRCGYYTKQDVLDTLWGFYKKGKIQWPTKLTSQR